MEPHLQMAAALLTYLMFHLIFYMCHKVKWFGKHWCVLSASLTPFVSFHSFLNPLQFGFSLLHSHLQHIHAIGLFFILFDDTHIVNAHFPDYFHKYWVTGSWFSSLLSGCSFLVSLQA